MSQGPGKWRGGDWGLWALGLGLALAWVPGIREQFTAPRLMVASLGVPLALGLLRRVEWGWWPLVLMAWAAVSTLWAPLWADALAGLWLVGVWAGAFALGRSRDVWPLVWGTAWGLVAQLPLVAVQAGKLAIPPGWWTVTSVVDPAGLFGNRNSLGEIALLVLVPLAFRGARVMPLALAPLVVLPESKTVMAAGALCVLGALWMSPRWKGLAKVIALVGVLGTGTVLALAPPATIESSEASVANAQSLELRLAIWGDTIGAWDWWGHGPGQFRPLAPKFAKSYDSVHKRFDHAHNDLIELVFELGVVGGALWLGLACGALGGLPRPEAFGLLALLGLGLGAFPLFNPATAVVGMALAGSVFGRWSGDGRGDWVGPVRPGAGGSRLEPDWTGEGGPGVAARLAGSKFGPGVGHDLSNQRAGEDARDRANCAV